MPAKTPRTCRKVGCPGKTVAKHGYCPDCEHLANNWKDNKHRHKRVRGRRGQANRMAVLKRDKGLCVKCLEAGRTVAATEVDHIIPLSQGGTDEVSNKQSLCHECHLEKTTQDRKKYHVPQY